MRNSQIENQMNEARGFLETLFHPLDENEQIEIRCKSKDPASRYMHRRFMDDIDLASRLAVALGETHDVYAGVAPRKGEIGTKEGVSRINALWADFDARDHITDQDIFRRIVSVRCTPSMLVHSGGGYHPYWLLKEPARSEEDLQRAENIMKTIAQALVLQL